MKNLKMAAKIYMLVGLCLLVGIGATAYLIVQLSVVSTSYESLLDNEVHQQMLARTMQVTFKKQVQAWKDTLLRGSDPALLKQYSDEFNTQSVAVDKLASDLRAADTDNADLRAMVDQFAAAHTAMNAKYADSLKVFVASSGKDFAASDALVKGMDRAPTDSIDGMVALLQKEVDDMSEQHTASVAAEQKLIGAIMLVAFGVLFGTAFMMVRSFVKPVLALVEAGNRIAAGDVEHDIQYESRDEIGALSGALRQVVGTLRGLVAETRTLTAGAQGGQLAQRGDATKFQGAYAELVRGFNGTLDAVIVPVNEAATVLQQVAQRDLSVRVKGDYQGDHAKIKDALNLALNNLEETLSQVSSGAEQVAAATTQISAGSQSLAQGSSEQASSLEEVSSSMQVMASMTKQNTANAKEARGLSDGARGSVARGTDSMKRLSVAIEKIKGSADATAKIVKTIDEIAFQTNLLALNAAVEAARAGDAGKGFAVVAEEVRNLAMRSAEAAKNTANLIEESVKNAESGVSLNTEVLKNLDEINGQVQKVSEVVAEISAGSEQQSEGVEQINTAIEQMNQVTQATAANAEESASAAEEMSGQAEEMRGLVAAFRLSRAQAAQPVAVQRPSLPVMRAMPKAKVSFRAKPARAAAVVAAHQNGNGSHAIPFDNDEATLQDF